MVSVLNVWILGATHPKADKSISWDEPFPNLGEPDVLIINLSTLTHDVLERIDKKKLDQARQFVLDKFFNNGIIIVLTAPRIEVTEHFTYSNNHVVPIDLYTEDVPQGTTLRFKETHDFEPYLKEIQNFNFVISRVDTGYVEYWGKRKRKYFVCTFIPDKSIKDNSGHVLGDVYTNAYYEEHSDELKALPNTGEVILLPPPTESIETALDKILFRYGKTTSTEEHVPEWANKILLPTIKEKNTKIEELRSQQNTLQKQINVLENEKNTIQNHRKLLYSEETSLEDAVAEAFKLLGFDEIRQIREKNREDWIFEFKHEKQFKYGVIEVKASENRTKQNNIVQCSKWVDERFDIDNKISKGIFIPNQHRLQLYPKSKDDRSHFEPNEIAYTKMKSICIIPSFVLFEAVKDMLDGKKKSRKEIEKLIAENNSVITKF